MRVSCLEGRVNLGAGVCRGQPQCRAAVRVTVAVTVLAGRAVGGPSEAVSVAFGSAV